MKNWLDLTAKKNIGKEISKYAHYIDNQDLKQLKLVENKVLRSATYLAFSIAAKSFPVHSQFVTYPSLQSTKLMFGLHNARKCGLSSPRYVFPTRENKRLTSAPNKNTHVVLYNLKRMENRSLGGRPGCPS